MKKFYYTLFLAILLILIILPELFSKKFTEFNFDDILSISAIVIFLIFVFIDIKNVQIEKKTREILNFFLFLFFIFNFFIIEKLILKSHKAEKPLIMLCLAFLFLCLFIVIRKIYIKIKKENQKKIEEENFYKKSLQQILPFNRKWAE